MRRTRRPARTAWAVMIAALLMAGPALLAPTAEARAVVTFADFFDDSVYSGSNGTGPWTTDWIEDGESDGPLKGDLRVDNRAPCGLTRCLDLRNSADPGTAISRSVDLGGFSSAMLTFTYQRHQHRAATLEGAIQLQARSAGGSWVTLRTYPFSIEDGSPQLESVSLDAFVSSDTAIRFVIEPSGGDQTHLLVDFLTITAWSAQPPATTTSSTTTTTTPATTTTKPPTTTTTVPPTTTVPSSSALPDPPEPVGPPPVEFEPDRTDAGATAVAAQLLNAPTTDLGATVAMADAGVAVSAAGGIAEKQQIEVPGHLRLLAGFSTAVEAMSGSLIPSLLLAAAVAWLSVRGLDASDRHRSRRRPDR